MRFAALRGAKFDSIFFRWLVVGAISLVLDITFFALGFSFNESVLIANLIAMIFSTTFNYAMHYFWTFKTQKGHKNSLPRYALNIILLWLISSLFIKLLMLLGLQPIPAKVTALCLVLPINFLSLRKFVYKD
jgi:putative flippase GtrA